MTIPGPPIDFFVSRRGSAAKIAQEVAQTLVDAGYKVFVQDRDISLTANFVAEMHEALVRCRHFIAILTDDYDSATFTREEWTNFFAAAAPFTGERRFIVLRADDTKPRGLFAARAYGDLVGVTNDHRRKEIILAAAEGRSITPSRNMEILHGLPPRTSLLVGRGVLLRELHQILNPSDPQPTNCRVFLHGLGGIGKTTLATEYAHAHAGDFAGVWWVQAETRNAILSSLAELNAAIDPAYEVGADMEAAANQALIHLGATASPWLLIYDNVERPEIVHDLLPKSATRVIVTTRWPDWNIYGVSQAIGALDGASATEFLLKRTQRDNCESAMRLAAALGCLPLALDHAASYLRMSGISFDQYAVRLQQLILMSPEGAIYTRSVGATIHLAIEAANHRTPKASTVLELCSVFAPDRIPLALIETGLSGEIERDNALIALAASSLITHDPISPETGAISVHRLVQLAMQESLTATNTLSRVLEKGVDVLWNSFPNDSYDNPTVWPQCEYLLPHARALIQHAEHAAVIVFDFARLMSSVGCYLRRRAIFTEAEKLFRSALSIATAAVDREDTDIATIMSNLAGLLGETGSHAEAEALFRESIALAETAHGHGHQKVADKLNSFAHFLEYTGRPVEAEPLFRKAISITVELHGRSYPDLAVMIHNLGFCLNRIGRIGEAETMVREAIDLGKKSLGRTHPHYAAFRTTLAEMLNDRGHYLEAELLIRQSISDLEEMFGREHPDVAIGLINLGQVVGSRGGNEEAEALFREAIAIHMKFFGEVHPAVAIDRGNLASLLLQMGRVEAAENEARNALEVLDAFFGRAHRNTKGASRVLADALGKLGRLVESAEIRDRYGI
jgi:tetratricopeptide (TPR) repeat protein